MDRSRWLALGRSLVGGAVGGSVFSLTGLPLAWMLGPLVANLLLASRGVDVAVPERLRGVFLGVMGLVLGARVTPELTHQVQEWWLSALLLVVAITCSTLVAAWWYRRRGFDGISALFSSAPGAMTAMIIMGEQSGGEPTRIAIAQSLRIVLVILLLPPLFWMLEDPATGMTRPVLELEDAWLLLGILPAIWLGKRLRLPTPELLAPLILAALVSVADVAHFSLPPVGMNIVLWVTGSAIGARFRGLSGAIFSRSLLDSTVATALALMVLAVFAELIHRFVGVPRDVALLALAPGGIGEMTILAVALNLDPVFVAFHHLLRMILLMFAAPMLARWIQHKAQRDVAKE